MELGNQYNKSSSNLDKKLEVKTQERPQLGLITLERVIILKAIWLRNSIIILCRLERYNTALVGDNISRTFGFHSRKAKEILINLCLQVIEIGVWPRNSVYKPGR